MPKHVFSLVFGIEIRSTGGIYIAEGERADVESDDPTARMEDLVGGGYLVVDQGAGAKACVTVLSNYLEVVPNWWAVVKSVLENVCLLEMKYITVVLL